MEEIGTIEVKFTVIAFLLNKQTKAGTAKAIPTLLVVGSHKI